MYARHLTTYVHPDRMDEALKIYEENVIPRGQTQEGYRGLYVLADRETGKVVSISFWDSKEDALANEAGGYLREQMDKFNEVLAGPVEQDGYEVAVMLSKAR